MGLENLRKAYGLRVVKGQRVRHADATTGRIRRGHVTGERFGQVAIRFEGEKRSRCFHPHDPELVYLAEQQTKE